MDSSEYTRIVHGRIQQLEPELASKIVGYLLLLDNSDQRMMQLASGPNNLIRSIIKKVKNELFLLLPTKLPTFQSSSFVSSPRRLAHLQVPPPQFPAAMGLPPSDNASSHHCTRFPIANHQQGQSVELLPSIYMDQVAQDHCLHNHMSFFNCFDTQKVPISSSGYDYLDPAFNGSASSRASPRLSGGGFHFPVKVCHYFRKGFCKHGSSCRYFHGNTNGTGSFLNNDQAGSPQSLEKLEWELTELLKSRNGLPVSIAMLPMRYYERYGKTLQAEGYLTESQRHGKAGYSLTKLLARMKNNICLIDRAHGQHAVILAEDLPEYMDCVDCHSDQGGAISICDRQIYLTFPAESKFSENDVSDYFSGYGPVEDVRIPNLQQRMYGFITFVYPETVRKILAIGNPHYVCNSRVLVKPYKEKSKLSDRKISQRRLQARCMLKHVNVHSEQLHAPRMFRGPRTISKHFEEPHEPQHELERRHLEIIMNRTLPRRPSFTDSIGYSMAGLKLTKNFDEQTEFPTAGRLNFPFDDISNTRPHNEEKAKCSDSSANDPESDDGINLPDSPFATLVANSI